MESELREVLAGAGGVLRAALDTAAQLVTVAAGGANAVMTFPFALAKVQQIDNGARHSFISYRCAESKDIARIADECGNSVATIKAHYHQNHNPPPLTTMNGKSPAALLDALDREAPDARVAATLDALFFGRTPTVHPWAQMKSKMAD